ncbi:sigma-70 family RNA polymerase sigma factor [Mycobacterium sp. ZZG]
MTLAQPDGSGSDVAVRDPDWPHVDTMFAQLTACAADDERRRWRQRIITECVPLADHIAVRFVGRGEPSEDLVQVARMGLVKSVDRYDPAKGRFAAFAVPTIRGEVCRHFRDHTWSIGQVQGRGVRRRRVILRGDGSGGQCRGGGLLFGRGVVDGA